MSHFEERDRREAEEARRDEPSVIDDAGAAVRSATGAVQRKVASTSIQTLTKIMKGVNIINAILLGVAGVFAFTIIHGSITRFFISIYLCFFAILLLAFETRYKGLATFIEKNFGFMFTYAGRLVFLVFVGALNFGMIQDDKNGERNLDPGQPLCIFVGVFTIVNALFNCFIICNHPHFSGGQKNPAGEKADPQDMTEEEVMAYIRAHPEVAATVSSEAQFAAPPARSTSAADTTRSSSGGLGGVSSGGGGDGGFTSVSLEPPAAPPRGPPRKESSPVAAAPAPAASAPAGDAYVPPTPPPRATDNPFQEENPFA
jgi:uncharacterized membrane protein YgcG